MADKFIEIEVQGEEKILLALNRAEESFHGVARDHVTDMSQFVTAWLAATVPTYDRYIMRHISREPATWLPGGAGGGGEWVAVAGIKAGTSRHPLYAEFGTGIYAGRGLIRARYDRARATVIETGLSRLSRRRGGVLTFQKHGEPRRFRYWVRGQKGQHYFYETWRTLNVYANARVMTNWLKP
jgi:hypothetical protein